MLTHSPYAAGCDAGDDVAGVPADAAEALRWADALCAPLLTGLARRRAAAPAAARDAAVAARDAAQRALEAADAAAAKARAVAAPGGAGRDAAAAAADDAADAAANATAAAASARTSATTAADAVQRLITSSERPLAPDFADAAAAGAAEAADAAEMLASAARGHAVSASEALGVPAHDAACGDGGGDATSLSAAYLRRETRPCPGCGLATIKEEGDCNAMHPCTKCKRTWCWSCLGAVHEHSFGPCSRAGNRAAIEAAVAAAAPDAAQQAALKAAAMAAADARVAQRRTGGAPRRAITPRAAQPRDAEVVPPDEAELAPLAMAADSLRAVIAADADVIARPLRLLRALLAAVVRTAATAEHFGRARLPRHLMHPDEAREAEGMRRLAEERQRAIDALRLAARRALAGRSVGEPLVVENHAVDAQILNQAVQAADAPLLAAAREAAAALAAAHGDDVAGPRDVDAAASAWASLFEARQREQAARFAAVPGGVAAAGAEPSAAWHAACRALAAAAAADSRCQLVRLAAALRIADVAALAAADDVAAVRNAAARCEASALAIARACGHRDGGGGFASWPPPRAGTDGARNAYQINNLVAADVTAAAAAASADAAVLQLLVDALSTA